MQKKLSLLFLLFQFTHLLNAQTLAQTDSLFADNNPKLNNREAEWLNEKFGNENFDFKNKYVGVGEYLCSSFNRKCFIFQESKKSLPIIYFKKYHHKLIILNSTQKHKTRGYDALIVYTEKKRKNTVGTLSNEYVVSELNNRYPQFPLDAGVDSSAKLSSVNGQFFNELYRAANKQEPNFDFRGKKIAIYNSFSPKGTDGFVSIAEYIKKLKMQLDSNSSNFLDFTYYLTEEEKKESGGFDVIIEYSCKKEVGLPVLIHRVKQKKFD